MGAKEKVSTRADGVADGAAEGGGSVDVVQRGLVTAAQGVGACRVEFNGGIALFDKGNCAFCRHVGVAPECGQGVMGERVEVCVGADAVIHTATEKRPDGAATVFAEDVPARDFKP